MNTTVKIDLEVYIYEMLSSIIIGRPFCFCLFDALYNFSNQRESIFV